MAHPRQLILTGIPSPFLLVPSLLPSFLSLPRSTTLLQGQDFCLAARIQEPSPVPTGSTSVLPSRLFARGVGCRVSCKQHQTAPLSLGPRTGETAKDEE